MNASRPRARGPGGSRADCQSARSCLERYGRTRLCCPFAGDADFVTIRGEHFRGRSAIGAGHTAIFRTIYAGSTVRFTVESARLLRPDVALLHVRSVLNAPSGPLAGEHSACFSMVLTKERGSWEIAGFHNTLEAAPGPPR